MLEHLAILLAALGLYFTGVGGIRANLQQIPGRKFRDYINRATATPLAAAWNGFLAGTVTQTSIGVTVILAGLISRGMATVRQALPMVAWSNVGLVVLVFLSTLHVHLLAMVFIGVCGVCINFQLGGRYKAFMGPFFFLGTVLFSLKLMKESINGLFLIPEFAAFMSGVPISPMIALLLGTLLRIPIQSSSAVALIGLLLYSVGTFTPDEAAMMFYGTALGSAAGVFLLTAHFRGMMRQVTLFEAIINGLAGVVMVTLFYVEKIFGVPLIARLADHVANDIEIQLAFAFLVQQLLCVGFAYLLLPKAPALLERLAPTTLEQDLSRPRFIHDQAVYDVNTALGLAEQELRALLSRSPAYIAPLLLDGPGPNATASSISIAAQRAATQAVLNETESFLATLSSRRFTDYTASVTLLRLERKLNLVNEIDEAVSIIARELSCAPRKSSAVDSLLHNLTESLDMLLSTAIAAWGGQREDADTLYRLTAAPGETIERLRRHYLSSGQSLDHGERATILIATTQHERVMLTLHQLCRAFADDSPTSEASSETSSDSNPKPSPQPQPQP